MAYLDNLDLLKVHSPPHLEGRGVVGVAGDEVIRVTSQAVQLAQLLCPREKPKTTQLVVIVKLRFLYHVLVNSWKS